MYIYVYILFLLFHKPIRSQFSPFFHKPCTDIAKIGWSELVFLFLFILFIFFFSFSSLFFSFSIFPFCIALDLSWSHLHENVFRYFFYPHFILVMFFIYLFFFKWIYRSLWRFFICFIYLGETCVFIFSLEFVWILFCVLWWFCNRKRMSVAMKNGRCVGSGGCPLLYIIYTFLFLSPGYFCAPPTTPICSVVSSNYRECNIVYG